MQGGQALGELSALDKRFELRLDRPSTLTFRVHADSLLASDLTSLSTDVMVYREGVQIQRFVIVSDRDVLTADSHYIELTCVDYRGRLESRLVLADQTYTAQDDVDIAWDAIVNAQAETNGNLGITRGLTPTGVPLTGSFPAGTNVRAAIDLIADVDDGFDWDIGPDLAFNIWRGRGSAKPRILDYGGLVTDVQREFIIRDFANVVRVSGDPAIASQVVGSGSAALGRWEAQVAFPNVANSTLLTGLAADQLNRFSTEATSYQVRLRESDGVQQWGGTSDIDVGDTLRLVIQSGRLDVNELQRVQDILVSVSDDGKEDVTLTLDGPRRTFHDRITAVYERLTELERT
jgi:hypothetical protein